MVFTRIDSVVVAKKKNLTSATREDSTNDVNTRINVPDGEDVNSNHDTLSKQYERAIQDLNLLQSNTQVIALAKYKNPEEILPLFRRQMSLAGIEPADLNKLRLLHVSGTKGKGSTCAFIESILRHSGLRTGFYNSPHLVQVTERIKLDGQPINKSLFVKHFRFVFDKLVEGTRRDNIAMPSYFSFLTILAFHIFLAERVDCAVIEVGIGGEYDPTNVIEKPVACGITTLDFDHTNVLGSTIEKIAWNKSGIIKRECPVFTIKHEQTNVMEVIQERARKLQAPLHVCQPLDSRSLSLGIPSSAQYINASLAYHMADTVLKQMNHHAQLGNTNQITASENLPQNFLHGLEACCWPGRCQVVQFNANITFFIDGAHTKKSMINCLEWFIAESNSRNSNAQQILMVNVIGDRDKAEVLRPLSGHDSFSHAIFSTNRINTAGDTPKSETFVNLQGPASEKSLDNVRNNVRIWNELRPNPRITVITQPNTFDSVKFIEHITNNQHCHVLATGSLHFVGAVLETLQMNKKVIK